MQHYIVLYRPSGASLLDEPEGFPCEAENGDHAEEQCLDAYPDCDVVWVWQGARDSLAAALADYYG